VEYLVK